MTRIETCTLAQPSTRLIVLAVNVANGRVEILPVVAIETRVVRDADGGERVEHCPVFVWGQLHVMGRYPAAEGYAFFAHAAQWPAAEDDARLADTIAEARKIAPRVAEMQAELRTIRETWEATA